MTNIHASNFQKDMMSYLEQYNKYGEPLNIVTTKGNFIVLSEPEYKGIKETLYLKSIPGMEKKLLDALNEPGEPFDWRKELQS